MSDNFYRAFEESFRGSRELIKSRLHVYLPFVLPLKDLHQDTKALDLGCGRGEWLDLLKENGVAAQGVDLDEGMLSACRERGLAVRTQDALSALKECPDGTLAVVSGFHIAEHLPFEDLQRLVQDSLRALKPGGILILETPNPENLVVGTSSFYLDPTHYRPIPAQLLAFLAEHFGFARTKTMGLNELPEIVTRQAPSLLDVLCNSSPDYALLAQKAAEPNEMRSLDAAFSMERGLNLNDLASRFEERLKRAERAQATMEEIKNTKVWRLLSWVNRRL